MVVRFLVCLLLACNLFISGCGVNVAPLPKYDNKSKEVENNAVVVIGTKNVSFLDLTEYTGSQPPEGNTVKKPSAQLKPKPTQYASADPNVTQKDNRYDLRRLFGKNGSSKLDTARSDSELNQTDKQTSSSEFELDGQGDQITINEYRIHKPSSFFNLFSYSKCTYVVRPGVYYISFAFYDPKLDDNPNLDTDFTRLPGVTVSGLVQYGAFKVNAGDVLYLGDITLDWTDQSKPDFVTISGNLADVKSDLIAAGEVELGKRIQPANFYRKGSKIAYGHDRKEFYLEYANKY